MGICELFSSLRHTQIVHALRAQLNWIQYRTLSGISDDSKRECYSLGLVHTLWKSNLTVVRSDSLVDCLRF